MPDELRSGVVDDRTENARRNACFIYLSSQRSACMATPSKLSYEVFISDPIPFSDTDKAPNGDRRMFQPISSTLIQGATAGARRP